jgi:uncharacterized protein (TIGR00255 family)
MIRSMTGFARAEASAGWGSLAWELRAVNHRYLEAGFRLPEELRVCETAFRQQVAERLKRGKVDCSLRLAWEDAGSRELALDLELATRLGEAASRVGERIEGMRPPSAIDVLRWPGVVREQERDLEPVAKLAEATLERALAELEASRAREGERLAVLVSERLDGVGAISAEIRGLLPDIRAALQNRMLERLGQIAVSADPQRFEQELVLQLTRIDVDEELDRLDSHVVEARRILVADGANGRRLDFLMQEFNREANTLGSKSVDTRTTRAAVELKVLIEQMREQVQNVE